jgi:Ca-activated chloride channel homolog
MPGSRAAESEQLAKLGRVESLARTRLLVEDRKKSLAAAPTHGGANPANRGMAMRQAQDLAFDPFDARQAAPAAPQAQSAAPLPGQPGPQVAMQGLNPAAGVNSSPPAAPAQALAGPAGQNQQGTFLFLNQAPSPNPALSSPAQAQNMAGNGSQPGQAPQTANNGAVASNKPANAQKPDPAMQGSNFGIANAPQPAQPSEAKRPDPGSSALSTGLLAGRSVEPQKPSAKAPDQNASNAILQGMHGVDYAAIVQPQPGGIAYAKNFKDLAPQRQPGKPAEVKGNEPALLADLQPGGNNDKPNGANPGDKPVADAVVEAGKNTREDDVKRERDAELGQLRQEVEQVQQQAIRIQERAQREEYARFYDNPFRAVLPGGELSTFAIDVDTASYANVRRFLAQGQLPPADAVRIEEMVNYFSYDDPAPKGDDPFSVRVEVAACPWDPGHRLARIGLKGRTFDPAQRPPSNLVFLIDTSGSMADLNKLPLLKAGLKLMVEKLTENDRLGIVVYSNDTREALPSTPCHRKEAIFAAIDGLKAEGGTNGGAGIQLAYKMATDNLIKGGTNRVLLATDGDFNVGLTKEQLLAQSEERAKTGVFLSVLGFGEGNLQDEFMEQLADKGNGNYSYIDSIDEARKVLVRQLSATLDVIAKDVKIQLEFNPSRVGSYRLIGYENRVMANEDFRNDKKDAGEIGAGHSLTALYEIVPTEALAKVAAKERPLKYRVAEPAAKVNDSPELFTVFLRFKQPDGDTAKEISQGVTDDGRDFGHASADLKFSASVAGFGMLLRGSPYRGTLSYPAVLEIASSALGDDRSGDRKGFLDLIRQAEQATNGPGEIAR